MSNDLSQSERYIMVEGKMKNEEFKSLDKTKLGMEITRSQQKQSRQTSIYEKGQRPSEFDSTPSYSEHYGKNKFTSNQEFEG